MSQAQIYQPAVSRVVRKHSIRDLRYVVNEWGNTDKPLLVYLHGWCDTGSTFQFVVDALGEAWHVVAPDWRGFGRTSCPCNSYWFPDYLADLHALLEIYSPQEPVRLVGHSMGANVGALYAGTLPARVRAFVNIEGFGLPDSDPGDAPLRYRLWLEQLALKNGFSTYTDYEALASRIRKRNPRMSDAAAAFVAREWAREGADGVVRLRADPLHKLRNPVLYRRSEAEACWRATTAEILMLYGTRSEHARRYGDISTSMYPEARHSSIADAGHMLHFEAPREVATAINGFLRSTL